MIFKKMPGESRGNFFNRGSLTVMAAIAMMPTIDLPSVEAALTRDPMITSDVMPTGTVAGPRHAGEMPRQSSEERSDLFNSLQDVLAKITGQKMQCANLEQQSHGDGNIQLATLDMPSFDDYRASYMRALSLVSAPEDVQMTNDELRTLLGKLQDFSSLIALDIEKCRHIDE
jgi:hypothetical protein